jgi:hypothetical protein
MRRGEQDRPIMDGSGEATPQERLDGLQEQLDADHALGHDGDADDFARQRREQVDIPETDEPDDESDRLDG